MSPKLTEQYNQPQKKRARSAALKHAVKTITENRNAGTIVGQHYVGQVKATLLARGGYDEAASSACNDITIKAWEEFWRSKVGVKQPSELLVAYLAGPEPMNDFQVLVDLGVHPHNIYAFETDNRVFNEALEKAKKSKFPLIKIFKMPMDRYLQSVPLTFDIIYFDACGPLPSTSQRTLRTVANVFRYQRLSQLGVLITNFAKPDVEDIDQLNAFSDIVASYLYPKPMLESGSSDWNMTDGPVAHGKTPKEENSEDSFFHEVRADFSNYYGQFITRQLFDIASFVIPLMRLDTNGLWSYFFKKTPRDLVPFASSQMNFSEDFSGGDYIVDPDMSAVAWSMTALGNKGGADYLSVEAKSKKLVDTWMREVGGSPDAKAAEVIHAYMYLRSDRTGQFLKEPMRDLLKEYRYAQNMFQFCDVPTGELALFPTLAQFCMPYHYNVSQTRRYSYVADGKSTEMFLDVIPFDTCRYIYDWLPSAELTPEAFDMTSHQLVFRFALDGLMKHTIRYNNEYVFGGHVVGVNETGYSERLLQPRSHIT
jgi:hypothetical protein